MRRALVLATLILSILALALFMAGCNESKTKSGSAGEQAGKAATSEKQSAEHPEHPHDATAEHPGDATAEHPASAEHAEHPAAATEAGEGAAAPATTSSSAHVVTTASGLKYEELRLGTGPSPQTGQIAVVHYTGWLTNGTKFDSSVDRGAPFEFPLGQGRVIKGWDEGVATMKVGGKRKLMIPPDLGYGARGAGNVIPPNAELVFDVELLAVK